MRLPDERYQNSKMMLLEGDLPQPVLLRLNAKGGLKVMSKSGSAMEPNTISTKEVLLWEN